MNVVRHLGVAGVVGAITNRDVERIAGSPGVGRKSAELICTLTVLPDTLLGSSESGGDGELIDALEGLGYERESAREALREARGDGVDGEQELLRRALDVLGAR